MKAVILAGGVTAKLDLDLVSKPKPMVEIGEKPLLWHIMKIYSAFGINDFIICLGDEGYQVKSYFANYALHNSDVTFDYRENTRTIHKNTSEPWKVTLIDTGKETATAGRLKKITNYLDNETFCFTYGDIVADIDIDALLRLHRQEVKMGTIATMTGISPVGRRGTLSFSGNKVSSFEFAPVSEGWINGGFFVLEPDVVGMIDSLGEFWETETLLKLQKSGRLSAYKHRSFWAQVETVKDRQMLDLLWNGGNAPWKKW